MSKLPLCTSRLIYLIRGRVVVPRSLVVSILCNRLALRPCQERAVSSVASLRLRRHRSHLFMTRVALSVRVFHRCLGGAA